MDWVLRTYGSFCLYGKSIGNYKVEKHFLSRVRSLLFSDAKSRVEIPIDRHNKINTLEGPEIKGVVILYLLLWIKHPNDYILIYSIVGTLFVVT